MAIGGNGEGRGNGTVRSVQLSLVVVIIIAMAGASAYIAETRAIADRNREVLVEIDAKLTKIQERLSEVFYTRRMN